MKYFQIGIVGVAVLLIPLISNQHDTSRDWRSLRATMIATICDLLTEMMCWIVDGQTDPGAMAINTFFAYWTIVFQSLVAVLWFSYVLQLLDWEVPHKYRRLIYLPFIYNMVDLALNPFTNARFIITAANRYTLGLLAPLDIAVTSIYVLSARIGGDEFCVIYENIDKGQFDAHIGKSTKTWPRTTKAERSPCPVLPLISPKFQFFAFAPGQARQSVL